jgi:hypothetical protein
MQRAYTTLLVEWLRRMLTEQAVAASPAPALMQTSP